jgi:hypothetical protein
MMTVRYIPNVGNMALFFTSAGLGRLWLVDALMNTTTEVYDIGVSGHCVMTVPFKSASRIMISSYDADEVRRQLILAARGSDAAWQQLKSKHVAMLQLPRIRVACITNRGDQTRSHKEPGFSHCTFCKNKQCVVCHDKTLCSALTVLHTIQSGTNASESAVLVLQVRLLDMSNPSSLQDMQIYKMPKGTGPHATVVAPGERLVAVSNYYVKHNRGTGRAAPFIDNTEKSIRLFSVAADGNSFTPHPQVPVIDFKNEFPHKGIAQPHGMAFKAVTAV